MTQISEFHFLRHLMDSHVGQGLTGFETLRRRARLSLCHNGRSFLAAPLRLQSHPVVPNKKNSVILFLKHQHRAKACPRVLWVASNEVWCLLCCMYFDSIKWAFLLDLKVVVFILHISHISQKKHTIEIWPCAISFTLCVPGPKSTSVVVIWSYLQAGWLLRTC